MDDPHCFTRQGMSLSCSCQSDRDIKQEAISTNFIVDEHLTRSCRHYSRDPRPSRRRLSRVKAQEHHLVHQQQQQRRLARRSPSLPLFDFASPLSSCCCCSSYYYYFYYYYYSAPIPSPFPFSSSFNAIFISSLSPRHSSLFSLFLSPLKRNGRHPRRSR